MEICKKCGSSLVWDECHECGGEEFSHHDCGDDTCYCFNPEPNVTCESCDGTGGHYRCYACEGKAMEELYDKIVHEKSKEL